MFANATKTTSVKINKFLQKGAELMSDLKQKETDSQVEVENQSNNTPEKIAESFIDNITNHFQKYVSACK
jgi:hypothetical protein